MLREEAQTSVGSTPSRWWYPRFFQQDGLSQKDKVPFHGFEPFHSPCAYLVRLFSQSAPALVLKLHFCSFGRRLPHVAHQQGSSETCFRGFSGSEAPARTRILQELHCARNVVCIFLRLHHHGHVLVFDTESLQLSAVLDANTSIRVPIRLKRSSS